jgi:hypothetical protein
MLTITLLTFSKFIADLANHDWYYDYSDDASVWRQGQARQKALTALADGHPIYQQAYSIYSASVMCPTLPLLERIENREQALSKLRDQVLLAQITTPPVLSTLCTLHA